MELHMEQLQYSEAATQHRTDRRFLAAADTLVLDTVAHS